MPSAAQTRRIEKERDKAQKAKEDRNMKEIYRSFEGKLDVSNRSGYILYQCGGYKEIHFLSVDSDRPDSKVRVSDAISFDFADECRIGEIVCNIEDGCYDDRDCAVMYRGMWYSGATICRIQREHHNCNWRKFI